MSPCSSANGISQKKGTWIKQEDMLLSKKTAQLLILVLKTLYFKDTVVHKEMESTGLNL